MFIENNMGYKISSPTPTEITDGIISYSNLSLAIQFTNINVYSGRWLSANIQVNADPTRWCIYAS